jgi:hypothetical protein
VERAEQPGAGIVAAQGQAHAGSRVAPVVAGVQRRFHAQQVGGEVAGIGRLGLAPRARARRGHAHGLVDEGHVDQPVRNRQARIAGVDVAARAAGLLAACAPGQPRLQRQLLARAHLHGQAGHVDVEVDRQPARQHAAGNVNLVGLQLDLRAVELFLAAGDVHLARGHVEAEAAVLRQDVAAGLALARRHPQRQVSRRDSSPSGRKTSLPIW